jgi:hypothetical protein
MKHWLVDGMKGIIETFGFEWRMVCSKLFLTCRCPAEYLKAPGEAEAELAYLNSIGIIDAVLSDDVDNFLFGAKMVIRKCVLAHSPSQTAPLTLLNLAQVPPSQVTASMSRRTQMAVWTATTRWSTPWWTSSLTRPSNLPEVDLFLLDYFLVVTTIRLVSRAKDRSWACKMRIW